MAAAQGLSSWRFTKAVTSGPWDAFRRHLLRCPKLLSCHPWRAARGCYAATAALWLWNLPYPRGNAAIELALIAAPLFLFLFGIIAIGQALWVQNALNASVAEAARCASINPTLCGTASQIQSYAPSQAGAGFGASIFSVSIASCGSQVSASYPLALTIPFISLSVNLSAQACYPT